MLARKPAPASRQPHSLRAEHHENPLGLGCARPRLSWKHAPAALALQAAWQIRAATTPELLSSAPDLFDTGRRAGSDSVFVEWPGPALGSRRRVHWQVRAWFDDSPAPGAWSEPAWFETGLLSPDDWQARWIGFGDTGGIPARQPCPHLRRAFELPAAPLRARLHASALGLFEFHLNGLPAHPGAVLAPGWTDFRRRVQCMTFDVTALLRAGPNLLGAILGEGWYAGSFGFRDGPGHLHGHPPALLAQLEIDLPGGRRLVVVSDSSWEGRTGPVLSADLYHGEHHDARRELPGWTDPAKRRPAPTGWSAVYERPAPADLLLDPRVAEPVSPVQEIVPSGITSPAPGVHIFDLGQNIAGWARLRWHGRKGQTLTLRFGEMLNPDGTLYTANLRTAKATDSYTFGRDGLAEWEPRFTFHGFRYVEVTGLDRAPDAAAITGVVVHNAMRPTGDFHCSDERVNRLAANIRWGLRGNFLEVPADCPQRDERLGWTGDIQIFSGTAACLYDTSAFLTKWMRDLRDGQLPDGAFPDIAPTFMCGFGNAAWADAGVIVPWSVYRHFGDKSILEENYAAMSAWIGCQESTSRNLIRPPTPYGDWLAFDSVSPYHAPVPSELVGTAYFAHTCDLMRQVAQVLGKPADARRFARLRREVAAAFRREFITPSGRVVGECQTAYLLALAFDLLPPARRPAAVERLVALIEKRDWHLTTGFVGTPLLCPVLSRFGRHDVAMKLLLQDTYPSWLFTVKNGATTMWERWNSYTPEQGFGDVRMNSFNHYAYGAVGEWMFRAVAGLSTGPGAPACRHLVFQPQPCDGLSHASAELETPYGKASIQWKTTRRTMTGEVVVPPNAFADFRPAPAFSVGEITGPARRPVCRLRPGTAARLRPGRYRFRLN